MAFAASLEGVGQALDLARAKYDDAYKRLHTGNNNIVRTGERCVGWGFRPRNVLRGGCWTKRTDWMPREEPPAAGDGGHDRQ